MRLGGLAVRMASCLLEVADDLNDRSWPLPAIDCILPVRCRRTSPAWRGCARYGLRNPFPRVRPQPLKVAWLLAIKGLRAYPLFLRKREAHKKEENYMNGAGCSRISSMIEICVDTACRLGLFPVSAAQFVAVSVGLFPDKTHVR